MTQQDKNQPNETKSQLAEGLRKSKAAVPSPSATQGDSDRNSDRNDNRLPANRQVTRASGYTMGGLRWPD